MTDNTKISLKFGHPDIPLLMTQSAVNKIHQLIESENDHTLMLRAFIMGGGCSGFEYNFTFTSTIKPGDQLMRFQQYDADAEALYCEVLMACEDNQAMLWATTADASPDMPQEQSISESDLQEAVKATSDDSTPATVTLAVDKMSVMYLQGSVIDYRQDLQGERFIIHNPNAASTCSCGSSFNTE